METLKGLACDLCLPVVVTSRLRTVGRSPWDGVPGIPDLLPAVALVSDSVIVLHRPFSPWRPGGPERPDPQSDKGLELVEARRVHPRRGGPSLAHLAFNARLARFDTIRWDM